MASEQYENEGSLRASLEKDLNIKITDEGSLRASLEKDLNIKITDEEREEIKEKNQDMKKVFTRAKKKLSEGINYCMDPGFVLLINNVNFGGSDNKTRSGSEKDVRRIQEFFGDILEWRVDVKNDLKASEIEQVVKNISQCKDFPYKALFIFILTHGSEKGVHGVDHEHVEVQSLVNKFKKINAEKKFWEIPKFFVIQACRGNQEDYAPRDGPDDEPGYVDESMQAGCENAAVTMEPTRIILPQMSNFLVAYACLDGYKASRDKIQGSWFIQEFLKIADQFYETENIVDIFNRVNLKVSNYMCQNKQIPIYEVGLRQRCFFPQYFIHVVSDDEADPVRSMSRLSLENRNKPTSSKKDSKLMDEVNVTAVIKDTVSCVQKCVKTLDGVHGMKEVLNQFAMYEMLDQLDKEERDALQRMITANSQVGLAFHFARVAVRTCKSIVETVCGVIDDENEEMSEKLKLVIHIYVQRVKELIPQLERAREELLKARVVLMNAIEGFENLKRWFNRKISELEGKAESEVAKQLATAYRGAVVGVVAVGLAVNNRWNPVGWVAGAVVIGGSAAVAEGVAAGVTERKTVGDLKKEYGRGITGLNDAIKLFEDMSKSTEESVVKLDKKRIQMMNHAAAANEIHFLVEKSSELIIDDFVFKIIKENVIKLDQLCDDYLSSPDLF